MNRLTALQCDSSPSVWLLMGYKAGDNTQVLALAEEIGWPFIIKRFTYRSTELLSNQLLGCTLAGIDQRRSSALHPPWPDLVITAGRRNEPIARWLARHIYKNTGKKVRLVHIGRPWSNLTHFDLVISTPQYSLPAHPNVLHNHLPLHRITTARLAAAAALWYPRVAHLPRPYLTLLIGGHSGPYTFDTRTACRLAHQTIELAKEMKASLLITSSARTPPAALDRIESSLSVPYQLFRWSPQASHNPYMGYLGLADAIVVTGESISMLTEACATAKPLYIFAFGKGYWIMRRDDGLTNHDKLHRAFELPTIHWRTWLNRVAMRFAPRRLKRDIRQIHQDLIASGRAVWLGERWLGQPPVAPPDDLARAVQRVRALFTSESK